LIAVTDKAVMDASVIAFSNLTLLNGFKGILSIVIFIGAIWIYLDPRIEKFAFWTGKVKAWLLLIRVMVLFIGLAIGILLLRVAGFGELLHNAFSAVLLAYQSMLEGSLGSISTMIAAIQSGNSKAIVEAFNPISESLVTATPYIFSGLSVAIGLRCGLFNIGTEGQLTIGAKFSVVVGYSFPELPAIIHIPLALAAGALGGALWAFIPAILKTKFGSNEVINTIMLNYVAFLLSTWLLNGPIRRPGQTKPISQVIAASAELPRFFAYPSRLHLGFVIAIGIAIFFYWFLFHTTYGLEIRLVGQNPSAAKYAGINIAQKYILAFCLSGMLGGLAGANEVLGVNHYLSSTLSPGFGFDAISLSILGNNHPLGVILTSLLFGTLRSGGTHMQNVARVPSEIITIVQALVIAFIAAPKIIRSIFHINDKNDDKLALTQSWGK
jgi:simple sugar transport system permease protein